MVGLTFGSQRLLVVTERLLKFLVDSLRWRWLGHLLAQDMLLDRALNLMEIITDVMVEVPIQQPVPVVFPVKLIISLARICKIKMLAQATCVHTLVSRSYYIRR